MPARPISIANRHPHLRLSRRAVVQAVQVLDAEFATVEPRGSSGAWRAAPAGELSLVFLTDVALARLHADFLDDPSITDVITFEGNSLLGTAGEICVSVDAAVRQLALPGRSRALSRSDHRPADRAVKNAFSAELTLYLVHGWLHLAGYDDLQPAKKRRMRRAEARAMQLLRNKHCIPDFTIRRASAP